MRIYCDLTQEEACVGILPSPALDWSEPLYHIDGQYRCHRLIRVGENLADMGMGWRETMVPCGDIDIFPDRGAAAERYPFRALKELMEEQI